MGKRIKHERFQNQKGFTLIGVLMVLVVISVLGVGILATTANVMKISSGERDDQSAFYIAEGGATKILSEIEKEINNLSTTPISGTKFLKELKETEELYEEVNFTESQAVAKVEIKKMDSGEYRIISTGKTGGKSRKVEGIFNLEFGEGEPLISLPTGVGVFSKGAINLNGGTITGNLITESKECGSITIDKGNPTINGTVIVPINACNKPIQGEEWWIRDKMPVVKNENVNFDFPLPSFPEFPVYPMMQDVKVGGHKVLDNGNVNITSYEVADYKLMLDNNYNFNNINLNSNRKLTFVIGNKDRSIVVDRIEGDGGNIYVEGTGTLTIYVKDNINLKGADFNPNGKNNLFIYIGPSKNPNKPKTFKKSDHGTINASIYAADANIELSGSASYSGHIVTGGKSVIIPGGTKAQSEGTVVYAPNAKVELSGSGTLTGTVIAKEFIISGGASVVSKSAGSDNNPIFPGNDKNNGNVTIDILPLIEK